MIGTAEAALKDSCSHREASVSGVGELRKMLNSGTQLSIARPQLTCDLRLEKARESDRAASAETGRERERERESGQRVVAAAILARGRKTHAWGLDTPGKARTAV